jgi:hypothetical protein
MYPHRIRLRGPWECTFTGNETRRATVPWKLADCNLATIPVLLTRKFGYPGRIDPHERVWLTLALVEGSATVTLNGHLVGQAKDGPFEGDVTAFLRAHNHLEILVQGNQVGEVAMEIRATAFLQGVRIRRAEGRLQVEGAVVGTCDRPLELYVLVDGRHALYRTLNAGESFTADLEEKGHTVRVELVHVSTVWYVVELKGEWYEPEAPAK